MKHQLDTKNFIVQQVEFMELAQLKKLLKPEMLSDVRIIENAMKSGSVEIVEYLLSFNSISELNMQNALDQPAIFELLLEHNFIPGTLVIEECYRAGYIDLMKKMLERDIQPNSMAIMSACYRGKLILPDLIHCGLDIDGIGTNRPVLALMSDMNLKEALIFAEHGADISFMENTIITNDVQQQLKEIWETQKYIEAEKGILTSTIPTTSKSSKVKI